MTIFDLVFFLLAGVSVATWIALLFRRDRARLLRRYLLGVVIYFGVVAVVSLLLPRRILRVGEPACSDDWCLAVARFDRSTASDSAMYQVTFKLFSRARQAAQREEGVFVYLSDAKGRRYEALQRATDAPFDTMLAAGESLEVTRTFSVPLDARDVGLAITRRGGFPIGWFIIGYETWFRQPALVRLS